MPICISVGATVFKPCASGYVVITLIFEAEKQKCCTTDQQQPLFNGNGLQFYLLVEEQIITLRCKEWANM